MTSSTTEIMINICNGDEAQQNKMKILIPFMCTIYIYWLLIGIFYFLLGDKT